VSVGPSEQLVPGEERLEYKPPWIGREKRREKKRREEERTERGVTTIG